MTKDLRPEFIALGKALTEPLTPVTTAPEPSADAVLTLIAWVVRNAEDLADYVGNNPELLVDMAMAAKRVHDRDRSAEATLAAVRAEYALFSDGKKGVSFAMQAIGTLLTPAPSPGAVRDMDWAAAEIVSAARAANCSVKYELKALPSLGTGGGK